MTEKDYSDDTSTVGSDTSNTSATASPSLPSFSPASSAFSTLSSSSLDINLTPPSRSTSRLRIVKQSTAPPEPQLEHDDYDDEPEPDRSVLLRRVYPSRPTIHDTSLWHNGENPMRRRFQGPDFDSEEADSVYEARRMRLQRLQRQEEEEEEEEEYQQQQQQQRQQQLQQQQQQQQRQRRPQYIVDKKMGRFFYGVIEYILDLFHGALIFLRPVFSLLIALAIFVFLVGVVLQCLDHFRSEVHTRLVCTLPAASFFVKCPMHYHPTPTSDSSSSPKRRSIRAKLRKMRIPIFADLIKGQASTIEMIADSVGGHLKPEFEAEAIKKMEEEGKVMGTPSSGMGEGGTEGGGGGGGVGGGGGGTGGQTHTEGSWSSRNHHHGRQSQGDHRREDNFKKGSGKAKGDHDSKKRGMPKNDYDDPYGLTKYTEHRGIPLPVLMKMTELAVEDLKVLVKYSTLPLETRDLVVSKLEQYVLRARVTSKQMQSLHSRAEGSLDGLAIRNNYLMRELKRIQRQQELMDEPQGLWDKFMDLVLGDTREQVLIASEKKLQQLYKASMEDARKRMRDIVLLTQDVLKSLNLLDETMRSINELTTQEEHFQKEAHARLSRIWTMLGRNRLEHHYYNENLGVLENMDGQRMAATGQIHKALLRITKFGEDMGVLREKIVEAVVDTPEHDPFLNILHPPEAAGAGDTERLESYTLMGHIEQIELVTARLKDRNFRIDGEFKSMEDEMDGYRG
ncbi:MAG: hypothetical protein J3Q66DRAFT_393211 [Benniella sp.]|nr:MAG: hypothetical protein J3Q66DRAFT_393211 [Benniella sp.]